MSRNIVDYYFDKIGNENIVNNENITEIAKLQMALDEALKTIEIKNNEIKVLKEKLKNYESIDQGYRASKKRKIILLDQDDFSSDIEENEEVQLSSDNDINSVETPSQANDKQLNEIEDITNMNDNETLISVEEIEFLNGQDETVVRKSAVTNDNQKVNESVIPSSEKVKNIKLNSSIKFDLDFWDRLTNGHIRKNKLNEQEMKEYEHIKSLIEILIFNEFKIKMELKSSLRKSSFGYTNYSYINGTWHIEINIHTKESQISYKKNLNDKTSLNEKFFRNPRITNSQTQVEEAANASNTVSELNKRIKLNSNIEFNLNEWQNLKNGQLKRSFHTEIYDLVNITSMKIITDNFKSQTKISNVKKTPIGYTACRYCSSCTDTNKADYWAVSIELDSKEVEITCRKKCEH